MKNLTGEKPCTMCWNVMFVKHLWHETEKKRREGRTCYGISGPARTRLYSAKTKWQRLNAIFGRGKHIGNKNHIIIFWKVKRNSRADFEKFQVKGEGRHIVNGHVPVHHTSGESPIKCKGKILVIDGGFSRAYQKETGIAGYTLIYNSWGMILAAHEPFTSTQDAITKESDILSTVF